MYATVEDTLHTLGEKRSTIDKAPNIYIFGNPYAMLDPRRTIPYGVGGNNEKHCVNDEWDTEWFRIRVEEPRQ